MARPGLDTVACVNPEYQLFLWQRPPLVCHAVGYSLGPPGVITETDAAAHPGRSSDTIRSAARTDTQGSRVVHGRVSAGP
jgi:hypothetical protein